jgi:hypothetical protein
VPLTRDTAFRLSLPRVVVRLDCDRDAVPARLSAAKDLDRQSRAIRSLSGAYVSAASSLGAVLSGGPSRSRTVITGLSTLAATYSSLAGALAGSAREDVEVLRRRAIGQEARLRGVVTKAFVA